MKAVGWLSIGVLVTLVLAAGLLATAWLVMARGRTVVAPTGRVPMGASRQTESCLGESDRLDNWWQAWRRDAAPAVAALPPALCDLGADAATDAAISLREAEQRFEAYLRDMGYGHLSLNEIMEFRHNYHTVAVEPETGHGVMELLLDKATGTVGPEMGPNVMWNVAQGMHFGSGMMGGERQRVGEPNQLSSEDAAVLAEQWLRANRPAEVVGDHADTFYGYYTFHTRDTSEQIVGLVSVHGVTGQVWYHTWHGDFVALLPSRASGH